MKKLPFIIAIPFIAVAIAIGVAMAMRMYSKASEPVPEFVMPNAIKRTDTIGKPSGGFGGSLETTISGDLNQELEATVDDEGADDLQELDTEASGL